MPRKAGPPLRLLETKHDCWARMTVCWRERHGRQGHGRSLGTSGDGLSSLAESTAGRRALAVLPCPLLRGLLWAMVLQAVTAARQLGGTGPDANGELMGTNAEATCLQTAHQGDNEGPPV